MGSLIKKIKEWFFWNILIELQPIQVSCDMGFSDDSFIECCVLYKTYRGKVKFIKETVREFTAMF